MRNCFGASWREPSTTTNAEPVVRTRPPAASPRRRRDHPPSLLLLTNRSYLENKSAAKARVPRLWAPDRRRSRVQGAALPAHSLGRHHARPRIGRLAHGQPSVSEGGFLLHGSDGAGAIVRMGPGGTGPRPHSNRSGGLLSLSPHRPQLGCRRGCHHR
jgi:hypothetical protein